MAHCPQPPIYAAAQGGRLGATLCPFYRCCFLCMVKLMAMHFVPLHTDQITFYVSLPMLFRKRGQTEKLIRETLWALICCHGIITVLLKNNNMGNATN